MWFNREHRVLKYSDPTEMVFCLYLMLLQDCTLPALGELDTLLVLCVDLRLSFLFCGVTWGWNPVVLL